MAVKHIHLRPLLGRLISLGVAIAPAITIADTQLYAQQDAQPDVQPETQQVASEWDWVPKEQLDKNQPCKKGCNGAYVAPKADWPEADKKPEDALVDAYADQTLSEKNVVKLDGNVSVSQGNRRLKAEHVTLDRNKNEMVASGNIELREPDLLLKSKEAQLDTQTNLGEFQAAAFLNHSSGTRGQAKTIRRESDTIITLEDGGITQCTPDDELWYINANKITLDSATGWGKAKHAKLEIKGVPIFYSPYLSFPIDERRKSGFLFPSFGSSGDNGFELSAPYYLNLAPNYDATISPRFISDRGTLAELELRHLSRFGQWALSGSFLQDDDIYTGLDETDEDTVDTSPPPDPLPDDLEPSEETEFTKQDRWLGNVDHTGNIAGVSTTVNYTKVSDNDYFRDLSINSLEVKRQTHLTQQAGLGYDIGQWRSSVTTQQYQTIDDDINQQYKFLPRATLEYDSNADSFEVEGIALIEYTDFQHDQSISKAKDDETKFEIGKRTFGEAGLSFPMQWPAGFIIPTAKVRSVSYNMEEVFDRVPARDDTYSATVPLATLDMGLVFERALDIGSSGFTQTLEPRAYYFYSDYEDQNANPRFDTSELTFSYSQLFRDTRFSGHDRLDDANQASMGITTRFIDDDSGREVLSASIGQIFYFKDRVVSITNNPIKNENTLGNSFIATDLQYQPTDNLWFSNTLLWDSRQDYLQEGGLSMQYQNDSDVILNAGYRYRRDGAKSLGDGPRDVDQLDLSVALPISESWKIYSRFQYDIAEDRSIEDMFGIGYEDCCWMVRLVYQRGIKDERNVDFVDPITNNSMSDVVVERDQVFVIEFQLKGLGGIGTKAAGILEESILGYLDSDK
jgi:LPS-assembly protein